VGVLCGGECFAGHVVTGVPVGTLALLYDSDTELYFEQPVSGDVDLVEAGWLNDGNYDFANVRGFADYYNGEAEAAPVGGVEVWGGWVVGDTWNQAWLTVEPEDDGQTQGVWDYGFGSLLSGLPEGTVWVEGGGGGDVEDLAGLVDYLGAAVAGMVAVTILGLGWLVGRRIVGRVVA
jgi:hypothetical protein